MIYVRWSILILSFFVGFRSLVIPQRHFEKGYGVKTRCRISLIYAVGKDRLGTREKRRVSLHSLSVGDSYESITNYRKPVVTHKIGSLVASYESCKIEGSCLRPLVDRLFHRLCLVGSAYPKRDPSSTSWNYVKVQLAGSWQSARSETLGQPT